MHVYPNGIKQHVDRRVTEPVIFTLEADLPGRYQFIYRLDQHIRLREQAQMLFPSKQLALREYLFCPAAQLSIGFEDRPFSTSAWLLHALLGSSVEPK